MSGKKAVLTAKSSTGEIAPPGASTVPPRYQPPPLPNGAGILKYPTNPNKDVKLYPAKVPEGNLNLLKYYPVPQHPKQYYPSHYPPQTVPLRGEDHNTKTTQVQVHQADTRTRVLDEPGIPQVSFFITSVITILYVKNSTVFW